MLSSWNASGDHGVIVGAVVVVVATAGAVVAAVDGIFLVALIGLETTGAHSEPVEHISQNASIEVNVNTGFSIVFSLYNEDAVVDDESTRRARRSPLEDWIPSRAPLTWRLEFTFEINPWTSILTKGNNKGISVNKPTNPVYASAPSEFR